jgi:hypothetical protein
MVKILSRFDAVDVWRLAASVKLEVAGDSGYVKQCK